MTSAVTEHRPSEEEVGCLDDSDYDETIYLVSKDRVLFEVPVSTAQDLSKFVVTLMEWDQPTDRLPMERVHSNQLTHIVKYIDHFHQLRDKWEPTNIDIQKVTNYLVTHEYDHNNDNSKQSKMDAFVATIIKDEWEYEFVRNIYTKGKEMHVKMMIAAEYMDMKHLIHLLSTVFVVNHRLSVDVLEYRDWMYHDESIEFVIIRFYDDAQVYNFYTELLNDLYDMVKLLQIENGALSLSEVAVNNYMSYLVVACRWNMSRVYDYWIHRKLEMILWEYENTPTQMIDDIVKVSEFMTKMQEKFGIKYSKMEGILISGFIHSAFNNEIDVECPTDILNVIRQML